MTASRTILAFATAAAIGSGVAWSPLAQAQSGATTPTAPPSASSAAPMTQAPSAPSSSAMSPNSHASTAPSASSPTAKPRSDAQVEARITQLHKELMITKDQESDWNTLAQDMRDNARAMSSEIKSRNGTKPMNAVDNLKSYATIADTHADGLKKIVPDFEKLYDAMSPAQKKTADTVFNQRVNQRVRTTATPSSSANHG
jgi:hypothetical protein